MKEQGGQRKYKKHGQRKKRNLLKMIRNAKSALRKVVNLGDPIAIK